MLKAIINTTTAVAVGADIPFTQVFNTNDSTGLNSSGIGVIKKPGFYDVNTLLTVTNVAAGNLTATFYSNGVELDGASVTVTSGAATDYIIIPLYDVIRAVWSQLGTDATISVRLSAAASVVAGSIFTIEKRK